MAYERTAWKSEAERGVFLFGLFGLYVAVVPIFPATTPAQKGASNVEV